MASQESRGKGMIRTKRLKLGHWTNISNNNNSNVLPVEVFVELLEDVDFHSLVLVVKLRVPSHTGNISWEKVKENIM